MQPSNPLSPRVVRYTGWPQVVLLSAPPTILSSRYPFASFQNAATRDAKRKRIQLSKLVENKNIKNIDKEYEHIALKALYWFQTTHHKIDCKLVSFHQKIVLEYFHHFNLSVVSWHTIRPKWGSLTEFLRNLVLRGLIEVTGDLIVKANLAAIVKLLNQLHSNNISVNKKKPKTIVSGSRKKVLNTKQKSFKEQKKRIQTRKEERTPHRVLQTTCDKLPQQEQVLAATLSLQTCAFQTCERPDFLSVAKPTSTIAAFTGEFELSGSSSSSSPPEVTGRLPHSCLDSVVFSTPHCEDKSSGREALELCPLQRNKPISKNENGNSFCKLSASSPSFSSVPKPTEFVSLNSLFSEECTLGSGALIKPLPLPAVGEKKDEQQSATKALFPLTVPAFLDMWCPSCTQPIAGNENDLFAHVQACNASPLLETIHNHVNI